MRKNLAKGLFIMKRTFKIDKKLLRQAKLRYLCGITTIRVDLQYVYSDFPLRHLGLVAC